MRKNHYVIQYGVENKGCYDMKEYDSTSTYKEAIKSFNKCKGWCGFNATPNIIELVKYTIDKFGRLASFEIQKSYKY